MIHFRPLFALTLVAAVLSLTSCVRESLDSDPKEFGYQLYVPALLLVGGIAGTGGGWFLRGGRFGWALMIGGVVAAVGFAPSMALDRITVDKNHFTVRTGIWGMTNHDVAYSDLQNVQYTQERKRGRRGRQIINEYLVCQRKDGTVAKVPLNNDVAKAAADAIVTELAEHEVPLVDTTGTAQ